MHFRLVRQLLAAGNIREGKASDHVGIGTNAIAMINLGLKIRRKGFN